MSKLPFEVSANLIRGTRANLAPASSVVAKSVSSIPFYRIVILAMAVTFLSVIAIGSAFAIAADDPLYCVSM